MRGHNSWSASDTRRRMKNKGRSRRPTLRSKADPIVLLLSAVFVVSVGLLVFFWPGSSIEALANRPTVHGAGFSCQVAAITDGDTLRCSDGTRVRLHAVAARESDENCSPGHPCPTASGAAATAKLSELASGQFLQCQPTGRSYGRVTAICRNEVGLEINCAMVESGTTLVWPRYNRERPICT